MKLDEIGFMKKLPQNKRNAITVFWLFALSGVIVASLFHFLGGVPASDSIADFVGILCGGGAMALGFWFGLVGKPKGNDASRL